MQPARSRNRYIQTAEAQFGDPACDIVALRIEKGRISMSKSRLRSKTRLMFFVLAGCRLASAQESPGSPAGERQRSAEIKELRTIVQALQARTRPAGSAAEQPARGRWDGGGAGGAGGASHDPTGRATTAVAADPLHGLRSICIWTVITGGILTARRAGQPAPRLRRKPATASA